jgi:hypothetical protein
MVCSLFSTGLWVLVVSFGRFWSARFLVTPPGVNHGSIMISGASRDDRLNGGDGVVVGRAVEGACPDL